MVFNIVVSYCCKRKMQERNWNWRNNRLFCHIFCHWWSFNWGGGSPGPPPPPLLGYAYAPIKENKKGIRKFSARFLVVSNKILTVQKIVLSSSRGQGNFRGLEASRPRPRTRPSRPRPRASKGLHLWYQHTLAMLLTSYNFWLLFANQLWADHFGTWLIVKLFLSG